MGKQGKREFVQVRAAVKSRRRNGVLIHAAGAQQRGSR